MTRTCSIKGLRLLCNRGVTVLIINVQQHIEIRMIKIGAVTNSSVLQIGTAGLITPVSNLANTGGFTKPAPTLGAQANAMEISSFVPLG